VTVDPSSEMTLAEGRRFDLLRPRRAWRAAVVRAGRSPAGDYRPLPKGPTWDTVKTWLTKADELVEVWKTKEQGLEIKRLSPQGDVKVTSLPPLSHGDPDVEPDSTIHAFKERRNGDLVMHWGDHLVLLPADEPSRALDIERLLKRRNEWASADI